ncbi:hypothetical protein [Paenibacillus sp. FSL A5-0031]|nr:hypothetical protein [Paenibacillus sp. FSL A5-0031]
MNRDIKKMVTQMTLEEKADMYFGLGVGHLKVLFQMKWSNNFSSN